jgi:hypothetical protein
LREPNIEDELLDPYNPKSIWAYMWFSDEELKPKRRRKKKKYKPGIPQTIVK